MTQPEFKHIYRIQSISEAEVRELFQRGPVLVDDQRLAFEDCMIGGTGVMRGGRRVDPLDMYLPEPSAQERFDAVVDDVKAGMREAEARELAQRRQAANAYMKARNIGASAVDLIPAVLRQPQPTPFEEVENTFRDWWRADLERRYGIAYVARWEARAFDATLPAVKWGVWMVRSAWSRA